MADVSVETAADSGAVGAVQSLMQLVAPISTIKVESSDGETFNVARNGLRRMSGTIRNLLEETSYLELEYLEYICPWDTEFLNELDQATLFSLILAANYLHITGLLDVGCQTVANMLKGKTTEEMRTLLNVQNDFSPEEQEQIRKENAWCEE